MSFSLWPHQNQAIIAAANAITSQPTSGLWVIPTGAGKTVAFLSLAKGLGWPTLVLVHRDDLIRQTVQTAAEIWPSASVGIIQKVRNKWPNRDLVAASVRSLRRPRLTSIAKDQFGLVIVDEAHHLPAPVWTAAVRHFNPHFLLGVTATPVRLDGKGLSDWFGPQPIYTYPLRQAIVDGRLARIRQFAIRAEVSLDDVATRAGDFAIDQLARAVTLEARDRVIVDAYQTHAADRKAIVFAVDLEHVRQLTAAFNDTGTPAIAVTGETSTEERRQRLAEFTAGPYRVLVNCEVCAEGCNERSVGCIIMARPTRSQALYQQCVGRGLRICPEQGKTDCLVLDITDNCRRHKLVAATDLFGAREVRDACRGDVLAVVDGEKQGLAHEEQSGRIEHLYPLQWTLQEIPPWPEFPSLTGYAPSAVWDCDPASYRQLKTLRAFGLVPDRRLTKGEAHYLLAQCFGHAEGPLYFQLCRARFVKLRQRHEGYESQEYERFLKKLVAKPW